MKYSYYFLNGSYTVKNFAEFSRIDSSQLTKYFKLVNPNLTSNKILRLSNSEKSFIESIRIKLTPIMKTKISRLEYILIKDVLTNFNDLFIIFDINKTIVNNVLQDMTQMELKQALIKNGLDITQPIIFVNELSRYLTDYTYTLLEFHKGIGFSEAQLNNFKHICNLFAELDSPTSIIKYENFIDLIASLEQYVNDWTKVLNVRIVSVLKNLFAFGQNDLGSKIRSSRNLYEMIGKETIDGALPRGLSKVLYALYDLYNELDHGSLDIYKYLQKHIGITKQNIDNFLDFIMLFSSPHNVTEIIGKLMQNIGLAHLSNEMTLYTNTFHEIVNVLTSPNENIENAFKALGNVYNFSGLTMINLYQCLKKLPEEIKNNVPIYNLQLTKALGIQNLIKTRIIPYIKEFLLSIQNRRPIYQTLSLNNEIKSLLDIIDDVFGNGSKTIENVFKDVFYVSNFSRFYPFIYNNGNKAIKYLKDNVNAFSGVDITCFNELLNKAQSIVNLFNSNPTLAQLMDTIYEHSSDIFVIYHDVLSSLKSNNEYSQIVSIIPQSFFDIDHFVQTVIITPVELFNLKNIANMFKSSMSRSFSIQSIFPLNTIYNSFISLSTLGNSVLTPSILKQKTAINLDKIMPVFSIIDTALSDKYLIQKALGNVICGFINSTVYLVRRSETELPIGYWDLSTLNSTQIQMSIKNENLSIISQKQAEGSVNLLYVNGGSSFVNAKNTQNISITLSISSLMITKTSEIKSRKLLIRNNLRIKGNSSLSPIDSEDQIDISNNSVKIVFDITNNEIPSIRLGNIGEQYTKVPEVLQLDIDLINLSDKEIQRVYQDGKTIVTGRKLNCDDWIKKSTLSVLNNNHNFTFILKCQTLSNSKLLEDIPEVGLAIYLQNQESAVTGPETDPEKPNQQSFIEKYKLYILSSTAVILVIVIIIIVVVHCKSKSDDDESISTYQPPNDSDESDEEL